MGNRPTGVYTIAGFLTHYLERLDLTRQELSMRLRVSVRTIHNIEHGRKRIDPRVLDQLAFLINDCWNARHPGVASLRLSGDHFSTAPESVAKTCLTSIQTNTPELLFIGDRPIASPELHWYAPGMRAGVPFAGSYRGHRIQELLVRMHGTFHLRGMDEVSVLSDQVNSLVVVRSMIAVEHAESKNPYSFKAYLELKLAEGCIEMMESSYDSDAIAEFLESGKAPSRRKSE